MTGTKSDITVVGSGLVGQATGKVLLDKGFGVTFVDMNPVVVSRLREKGYQAFLVQEMENPETNIFMLCIRTCPVGREKDGLDSVRAASISVGRWMSRIEEYCLVVVRSTVLPGTTEEVIIPNLEEYSGKQAGIGFGVCVHPEYLGTDNAEEKCDNQSIVVIGELDTRSGDLLQKVHRWVNRPIYRITPREAEMQKFVHNLSNAAKISFFNEMRMICQRLGIDPENVFPLVARSAEALLNPLYGTYDLGPFGGKYLPKDTSAFLSWASEHGLETPLMNAALEVNKAMERQMKPALSWSRESSVGRPLTNPILEAENTPPRPLEPALSRSTP